MLDKSYFSLQARITAFHLAAIVGNVDFLKILYNKKPGVAMAKDNTGRSALHYACGYEGKYTAALKYLVCDIELKPGVAMAKDNTGRSALHYACGYEGKYTAALKYLVCDIELEVDHCDQVRM
jgi:ankyrin repeat protein